MPTQPFFGEIIESSLSYWKVHCWQWDVMPPFGSLLVTHQDSLTLFGIVSQVHTGSLDPGRHPFPYQKTEEQLRREQPQIFALLQTHVMCLMLGYQEDGALYYQLPPYPPKIHAFVRQAQTEEMMHFFQEALYMHLLCNAPNGLCSLDELLLAMLKQLAHHQLLTQGYLESFINTLSGVTGNDYRKFKIFLQRIEKLTCTI